MRTSVLVSVLALPLMVPVSAVAQAEGAAATASDPAPAAEAPPAAAAATAPATPTTPPVTFTWEALVDTYYLWNFTGDPSTQGPALRQFDVTANNFALAFAKLGVGVDTEHVAFRLDLGGGHAAVLLNGASAANSPLPPATGTAGADTAIAAASYDNGFLVEQAYGTLKLTPALSLDAGRFVTSAGAEVIEANKNWLYSRSLLFFGIPLLHTGVRLTAAATSALKVQLSLVNGWNNDPDNNVGKTGGISVIYSPPESGLTAALTSYIGKEQPGSGGDVRYLVDAVLTKDIGNLSLGANVDYFKQGEPWWIGGAVMGRLFLTNSFNLAARGEIIASKQGAYFDVLDATGAPTGVDMLLYEGTLMAGYIVAKHFELRAELRGDFADQEVFLKGSEPRKNQLTATAAFLTYF